MLAPPHWQCVLLKVEQFDSCFLSVQPLSRNFLHHPLLALQDMSSFVVVGFFGLAEATRKFTIKKSRNGDDMRVYHVHYTTCIQCTDCSAAAADLRIYSPFNDSPLPNETVAFVIAKAYAPPGEIIQLEAFYLSPVPGDPSEDEYDERAPNVQIPFVFAVGQVCSGVHVLPGTDTKCFSVNLTEYVRDENQSSSLMCVPLLFIPFRL
jgi:hypothetical protein